MNEKSEITLSTGQKVEVWTVGGVVADDKHSSSTRVYSSGGGGHVGPYGGEISAPEIHSQTITRQSFWITDSNGKDHDIHLTNLNIPLRVGQRVTARFVLPRGESQWRLATFTNHSAELFYIWAGKFDPQLDWMAADRGSSFATALVVGGSLGCWVAYRRVVGTALGNVLWLWVGALAFAGLAVLSGILMRAARRSTLRLLLRAEYVEKMDGLGRRPVDDPAGSTDIAERQLRILRN